MESSLQKNILDLTCQLITLRTTSQKIDALHEAIGLIEGVFSDTHLIIKKFGQNQKPSLVISTQDTLTPDILLLGHLDVVEGSDGLFVPQINQDILLGRGAADMKSEVAVMVYLMKQIALLDQKPNIALMLVTDEEIGGFHGAKYLTEEIGYRAKMVLAPDGGGETFGEFIYADKGVLHIKLSVKGISTHGSRPWLGTNALDLLISDIQKVQALFPLSKENNYWCNTITLGKMNGGVSTNQVPDRAEAFLDIRYIESFIPDQVLQEIKSTVLHSDVEVTAQGDATYTDPKHPYVEEYLQIIEKDFHQEVTCNKSHGANDGRFFSRYGIPILVSRPLSGGQHSEDEWLSISSLFQFYEFLEKFVREIKI